MARRSSFIGNGAGTGKIYELSDAQLSDDGAAIPSYYTTYFFPSQDQEDVLGVRSHRKLFSYLTCYAEGAGNLSLTSFAANKAFPTALPPLALSSPGSKDLEMPINVLAERAAFQVGTNQAGSWFRLSRLVASLAADPWARCAAGISMLNIPQLAQVKARDPYVYESLQQVVSAINSLGRAAGVDPSGSIAQPAPIGGISVVAADGIFDIAITDNSAVHRGIYYFAEADTSPNFTAPRVYFMGSRAILRVALGNLTLYWRGYSQYIGSTPSAPVTFGSPPTAVAGGGSAGPALQASSGSGTATGQQGGSGFGTALTLAVDSTTTYGHTRIRRCKCARIPRPTSNLCARCTPRKGSATRFPI